ncbi:aldehyde dehydrogenase family protein [Leeia sp. TBRC 13508]|uniref:Aldehyde dehydrogenase family protein n=1 Tax=Leeia speluncae TaxID=2884804 RepID=A0ABS8D3X9_9NEIS|nr:aldehyde dehydrogenase family protein [Leeia speluncae]MCB6182882.1 aldehyde dehydrogenase family protein [Leeia speluncae]
MSSELLTRSPVDGSVVVSRVYHTPAAIEAALTAAVSAQKTWKTASIADRAAILSKGVDNFVANKEQIALELTRQMGRPIRYTPGEVGGFEARARHMISIANEALHDVVPAAIEGFNRFIRREPVGVVLVVAPWNYPLLTAVNAVVPALMAGNAVILKHSAQTPLAAERMVEAFSNIGLPEGLFQFIHTDHEGTQGLIQSPMVNAVCFTGSVKGGEAVEQAAAGRFIPVGLELGGNDPGYVRADADVDQAVDTLIDGAFFNSGQSCCGIQRIYVHASLFDQFIEKAVRLTNQYKLGDPMDPETTLGPVVRTSAADSIRAVVTDAITKGAKTLINAADFPADQPGSAFVAPQILVNVNHSMAIMNEECFGPVVGIMPVKDDAEAVQLMNDSPYGLTASIFTKDETAALAIGDQLETGTVFMNRCDYLDPALAWTGVKNTGRGATLSSVGYEHLTRPKSFHLKKL